MDPKLRELLVKSFGLDPNATDDQAVAKLKSLSNEQRAALALAMGGDAADKIALLVKKPEPAKTEPADDDTQIVALETKRITSIRSLASTMVTGLACTAALTAVNAAADLSVGENLTLAQSRQKMQTALASALKPITGGTGTATVHVGEDQNVASLRNAIPQAIMLRANPSIEVEKIVKFEQREALDRIDPTRTYLGNVHERAHVLKRQTMLGMFRSYLVALGVPRAELDSMGDIVLANTLGPRSLRSRFPKVALLAESTSDFASITLDAINKSLRYFYLDAPRSWDSWAQRTTANDFKNINRVVLSEAPDMNPATEGKEINYVALTDSKETYTLAEYKAGIKLTRRAIINDDQNAFSQIPRLQANSAVRKEEDVAYAVLTGNAAMADTIPLFHASHANLAGSGTAISIASLQTAATAVMKQKGLAGKARLELKPKKLLVPTSIYETTRQMIGSPDVMPVSGATPNPMGTKNPFYGRYDVTGSTRLDDSSATRWYLMADYRDGQINTVEVCFLTDEPEPVLRQETDFDTEDVKYLVRHTVAAKAIDYRGLYANPGA